MFTSSVLALWISRRASSAGSPGRSALTSRTTSSYFFSASWFGSNSTSMRATPGRMRLLILRTSSSPWSVSSICFTTSRSRSPALAPGYTATIVKVGKSSGGSSLRGMLSVDVTPSAASMTNKTTVNCQCLTENSVNFMAAPSRRPGRRDTGRRP